MTQMLRTGNDLALTTVTTTMKLSSSEDYIVARNALHNILYTVVNSNAMNGYSYGTRQIEIMPVWETIMICVSSVLGAAWLAWGIILVLDGVGKTHIVYELSDEPAVNVKKRKGKNDEENS